MCTASRSEVKKYTTCTLIFYYTVYVHLQYDSQIKKLAVYITAQNLPHFNLLSPLNVKSPNLSSADDAGMRLSGTTESTTRSLVNSLSKNWERMGKEERKKERKKEKRNTNNVSVG